MRDDMVRVVGVLEDALKQPRGPRKSLKDRLAELDARRTKHLVAAEVIDGRIKALKAAAVERANAMLSEAGTTL